MHLEDDRLLIALVGLGHHVQYQGLVLVFDGRDTDPGKCEGRGGEQVKVEGSR